MRVTVTYFFNDTATTEIYTLSLHDALPISCPPSTSSTSSSTTARVPATWASSPTIVRDRKSTRLNSSHQIISYAVFCLKKKKKFKKKYKYIDNIKRLEKK